MFNNFGIITFLRKDSIDSEWYYCVALIVDHKEVDIRNLYFDNWSLEEYEQQWCDGLERIKHHNSSCLVIGYEEVPNSFPNVMLWSLFKVNHEIIIQPQFLMDHESAQTFQKKHFTKFTCYDFIRPKLTKIHHELGGEYLQWKCKYDEDEINKVIEKLKN